MTKLSIRLSEQSEYDFEVVKDYLFEAGNKTLLDIDVSNSNVIKQALSISAYLIENNLIDKLSDLSDT